MNRAKKYISITCVQLIICIIVILPSCSIHKATTFYPNKKIPPTQLKADFALLKNILETEHPSIYWHTTPEVINTTFAKAATKLNDSLTEIQFRKIVSEVVSQLKCGHTSVRGSKGYEKWINTVNIPYFPFGARLYSDTILLTYNLYRKDTILPRGAILQSINGISSTKLFDTLYNYLSTDADANNFKNIRLSNNFPLYTFLVLDSVKKYTITYTDTLGKTNTVTCNAFKRPPPDTTKKITQPPIISKPLSQKERRKIKFNSIRRMQIDAPTNTAILTITSFSGGKQQRFFKKAFKEIQKRKIENVVFDVRNNGGGIIGNSTALTKYITTQNFKVADSIFAVKKTSRYNKYIRHRFWYGLSMLPLTRKKSDGNFHFTYFERKQYKPKKKNHFDGNVYAITGGYAFSATTLFLNVIKNQPNVILVGEETGGGAYGNSAVYIPDLTLPYSKLRVRMPIFRVVMKANVPKTNTGIQPHYYVPPTINSIINGGDPKMEKVFELIKLKRKS